MIMVALAGSLPLAFFTMFTDHNLLVISDLKAQVPDLEQRGQSMQGSAVEQKPDAGILLA